MPPEVVAKIVNTVTQLQRGRPEQEGVLPVEVRDHLDIWCEQTMRDKMRTLWQHGELMRIGGDDSRRGYRALTRAMTGNIYHASAHRLLTAVPHDQASLIIAEPLPGMPAGWLADAYHVLRWFGTLAIIGAELSAAAEAAGLMVERRVDVEIGRRVVSLLLARKMSQVRPRTADREHWRAALEPWAQHPTQLPVSLVRRLIDETTRPGDLVIDPFAAYGSTPVAAGQTGRQWIAGHIDAGMVEISRCRVGKVDRHYIDWLKGTS